MRKTIATLFSVFFFGLLAPTFSHAATMGTGFTVVPAILHLSVTSGGTFRSSFTIKNPNNTPTKFTLRAVDFVPVDDRGGVREIPGAAKDDSVLAAGWISLPAESVSVPPHKNTLVPFDIIAPSSANPGAHQVAIAIETTDGNVHTRIYALCFISVPGNAHESLDLLDFSEHPSVTSGANGTFGVTLKNTGATFERPEGEIVVRNMFGAIRGRFVVADKQTLGTLIPGAKRGVEYAWSGPLGLFDFGLWSASLSLNYGASGEHTIGDRAFFLVLPWRALLLIVLVIGGALLFFRYALLRLRKQLAALSHEALASAEVAVSIRLLIIPFVAGLLLLAVIGVTVFSVSSTPTGESRFERVEKVE